MTNQHYLKSNLAPVHLPQSHDPVEVSFKWILILGRLLGAVPFSISLKAHSSLQFRWCSFSAFHSLLITFVIFFVGILQMWHHSHNIEKQGAILEQLKSSEHAAFHLTVFLIYAHFLKNSKKLIDILNNLREIPHQLNFSTKHARFPYFCIVITVLILSLGIAEDLFYEVSKFKAHHKLIEGMSLIQKLLFVDAPAVAEFVPYHPVFTIFVLYCTRMGTYAWSFGDIFLIVLCRALSFTFYQMEVEIKEYLQFLLIPKDSFPIEIIVHKEKVYQKNSDAVEKTIFRETIFGSTKTKPEMHLLGSRSCIIASNYYENEAFWTEAREKILKLCVLSKKVTSFVGPLVLACYGFNIFLIIIRIMQFLYNSNTIDESPAYVISSSLQFILRVILVTHYAAQVYHSTESIVHSLEFSKDTCYSDTACRLERMLERHPVGVTIFGAIEVTRKFFISIISFMFTTEIVLLQAMSSGSQRLPSKT